MSKFVITGGAGYLGSYMAIRLLQEGHIVKVIDKTPQKSSLLPKDLNNENLSYLETDICNSELDSHIIGFDTVIHFAANTNAKIGFEKPQIDFHEGIYQTFKVLESMKQTNINKIIFSSSGTVYGDSEIIPTSENANSLSPISIYGAAKLSSENLINAFCNMYDMKSWIFRIGNVVGKDCRKGVIFDLIKKLQQNSQSLEVLGNGEQTKDYVYIDDCIDSILHTYKESNEKINVYNVGSGSTVSVKDIVQIVLQEMNLNPTINYLGGPDGWKGGGWEGDVAKVHLNISKIKEVGWSPKILSSEIIRQAIKDIL